MKADTLPANIDAEKTILGALLWDNERLAEVGAALKPSDFSLDSNSRIMAAMMRLARAGSTVDTVTLCAELDKGNQLKGVGGRAYLFSLTEGLPRIPKIDEYVRLVKEKSELRYMLTMFSAGTERARDRGAQPEDIRAWMLAGLAPLAGNGAHGAALWTGEGMETFLAGPEAEIEWLILNVLRRCCLTEIYAPRGLGKSILAHFWGVSLAARGLRVMLLDRDNARHTVRQRLRGFAAENLKTLRVISREKCPPLTQPEAWASFPYADYDLVIVDSLDAMAEGVGEQDSAKPAKAMAPLLDICHRENGPAVLLLGNTIKSALHSRGSGVIEDRGDIVYEMRDATDFKPSGTKPWIEELPAQGAAEWAARSARRKGRSDFRVALVATKFRDGEEPSPRILEARLGDIPYIVADVTASVDATGEAERMRLTNEKQARHDRGIETLFAEIDRRYSANLPAILKREAEDFLMASGSTKREARSIVEASCFTKTPGAGQGHPIELGRLHSGMKVEGLAERPKGKTPNKDADTRDPLFGPPHEHWVAEIYPSETPLASGDLQSPISATLSPSIGKSENNRNQANSRTPVQEQPTGADSDAKERLDEAVKRTRQRLFAEVRV